MLRFQALAVLLVFALCNAAWAEKVQSVREYRYSASENDSKLDCRNYALGRLKADFLEEIGTYVESQTTVQKNELTRDEITSISAGNVSVVILEETWDGTNYFVRARLETHREEIQRLIALSIKQKKEARENLDDIKRQRDEEQKKAEKLQAELQRAQANQPPPVPGSIKIEIEGKAFEDIGLSVFTLGVGLIPVLTSSLVVKVDGVYVDEVNGYGDVRVNNLTPGNHLVHLLKNGEHSRLEEYVQVYSGKTTVVKIGVDTNFKILYKDIYTSY